MNVPVLSLFVNSESLSIATTVCCGVGGDGGATIGRLMTTSREPSAGGSTSTVRVVGLELNVKKYANLVL